MGYCMKRSAGVFLALGLFGCGTTLPNEDSVTLVISSVTVDPGEEISAVLMNASTEVVGLGVLPCTSRIVDNGTGIPIAPPQECEQPMTLLKPGQHQSFVFVAPTVNGTYRLEISTQAPYEHSAWGALDVRSAAFTVAGPEPTTP